MATGKIWNGFGKYEQRDGELGITIGYGGIRFWLPYEKVTYIPNFSLREVDHDKSTAHIGETSEVVYRTELVMGNWIVVELTEHQIPRPYNSMGIISITGKPTGKMVQAWAGWDSEGHKIYTDVPEVEPTRAEMAEAAQLAKQYKETVIADYFQSKRERMTGGRGALHPSPYLRTLMDELGVEDIDDVAAHAKNTQADPVFLRMLIEEAIKGASQAQMEHLAEAVNMVRSSQKAQLAKNKPNPLNLADEKKRRDQARWDALPPEEQERRKAIGERLVKARAEKAAKKEEDPEAVKS